MGNIQHDRFYILATDGGMLNTNQYLVGKGTINEQCFYFHVMLPC